MNSKQNIVYPGLRKIGKSINKCITEVLLYLIILIIIIDFLILDFYKLFIFSYIYSPLIILIVY